MKVAYVNKQLTASGKIIDTAYKAVGGKPFELKVIKNEKALENKGAIIISMNFN